MRFLFQAPPGLGFFDCAGVRLMLDAPARAQANNYSSVIYYRVPNLQAAFETAIGLPGGDPEDRLAPVDAQLTWMRAAGL